MIDSMTESPTGSHNADHLLRPLEQGMVESFDALFAAREKSLKKWLADQLKNKQEFLHRTFPSLVQVGAEHPQLSGGVLYMMGLITEHTHQGSEAINSIPRRFAERRNTAGEAVSLRPTLAQEHKKQEARIRMAESYIPQTTLPGKPELKRIFNKEMERAKITRELYDFVQCPVPVRYTENGKPVDLGINSSEVSILNKDSKTGKSMVFICSSAGNPPGAESFVVEYALRTGNKVYVIGQPDGASGHMTQTFADAAVRDAEPPRFDPKKTFAPPSYRPHTEFMKQVINTIVPSGEQFDLYSHSGGGIEAKNLLHDPDISSRVKNAVFLNSAGVSTTDTLFPILFRRLTALRSFGAMLRDLPNTIRWTFEKDRNESKKNAAFWFRDRVTVAYQSGTHYRQPDWDTMKVNGGDIVLYVGGNDTAVGGKKFATFMKDRLSDTAHPTPSPIKLAYDPHAHHVQPFTHPEEVLDTLTKQYSLIANRPELT